jgi:hypothetical protein
MKNLLKALVLLTFLGQLFSVTVDGYAFLEDQTNFRGINVIFQRVVPDSLELYRVSTDSTGYFTAVVEPGYYDVEYVKNGFSSTKLEDVPLYSNQSLSNQTLTARGLEGEIKGILTEGEYNVSNTLTVPEADSLIIEPGVILNFNTDVAFIINGYLNAEGTGGDSIIFKPIGEEWIGIRFQQSSGFSSMRYCSIRRIKETAVIVEESDLSLSNSDTTSKKNGIFFWAAGNCDISNCEMSAISPGGEGIYISPETVSEITLSNLRIEGFYNSVLVMGGYSLLENCVIVSNSYGLVLENPSVVKVINCNIKADIGIQANSSAKVYNSILQGLNNGYGVGISRAMVSFGTLEVFNTNVYGVETDFDNCGPYLGVIVTANANGDPCDAFGNISMDPGFVDDANGDFSLQSDSPCIDAGTNSISDYVFPSTDIIGNTRIWDGDDSGTSIVDIGAYEYGSSIPVSIEDVSEKIQNYQLSQNYPNPFNPVTTISYALPQASNVELNVYNLNGQLVQSLVNGRLGKGMHKAEFNGADLTSGMYIYNLKVDNKVVSSKKMMLLK